VNTSAATGDGQGTIYADEAIEAIGKDGGYCFNRAAGDLPGQLSSIGESILAKNRGKSISSDDSTN
jgi:hypothetical protein